MTLSICSISDLIIIWTRSCSVISYAYGAMRPESSPISQPRSLAAGSSISPGKLLWKIEEIARKGVVNSSQSGILIFKEWPFQSIRPVNGQRRLYKGGYMNEKFFALPEEKRHQIINAAIEVFSKYDYKHASTDLIAAKAGISKGSLFYYFHNKILKS